MKNISFLISLLLLTTLLHEAQGMKSRKLLTKTNISSSISSSKIEGSASETNNGKKSTRATTKRSDDREKQESFSVKSSPVVEERQAPPKQYPDVLDLAGMDYSPARRKSPIHN